MLPKDVWQEWEPRMILPLFKGVENTVDFIANDDLNQIPFKQALKPMYFFIKKQRGVATTAKAYSDFVLRKKIEYRGVFLDRSGNLLFQEKFEGRFGPGDLFSIRTNDFFKKHNVIDQDAGLILIASRGRMDRWFSSPGSATARYVGASSVSGFRTGFFSRPLNSSSKAHFGFTGVNTQVCVADDLEPAVLLMNHSSNPGYNNTITPTIRLYKAKNEFLENSFGEIAPFGIREQKILELFPTAKEFLKESKGWGCAISKASGATLGSVHILRHKNYWGMDHSRPLQMNVIKG